MRITSRSLSQGLVLAAIVVVLGMLLLPAIQRAHWVGSTDLEIEYIVTDAVTGELIKGATITVHAEGGDCAEREKQRFSLVTDATGSVNRLCKGCMCFGTSGWNIDTYVVHLPWWYYQVTAEGYSTTAWTELDVIENVRNVLRGNPAAKLVVPIMLTKKAPEPANDS
jgi:hypothetical protein